MRAGLRAWDADTHVNPAAEVLDRYVDPSFRPRLPELAPYRFATGQIGSTNYPYFPGYQDLWDNIFLGRLASHP